MPRFLETTRAVFAVAIMASCEGDKDPEADADVEADSDCDTDADSDTDADADLSTAPCPNIGCLDRSFPLMISETDFAVTGDPGDSSFNTLWGGPRNADVDDVVIEDIVLVMDNFFRPEGDTGLIDCSGETDPLGSCFGENFVSGESKSIGVAKADWPDLNGNNYPDDDPPDLDGDGVAVRDDGSTDLDDSEFGAGCYSARIERGIEPGRDGAITAFFLGGATDDDGIWQEIDIAEIFGTCAADLNGDCVDYFAQFPYFQQVAEAHPVHELFVFTPPVGFKDLNLLNVPDIFSVDPAPRFDMLWLPSDRLRWWVNTLEVTDAFYSPVEGGLGANDFFDAPLDVVPDDPLPVFMNFWAVDNDGAPDVGDGWMPDISECICTIPPDDACTSPPGCTPASPILDANSNEPVRVEDGNAPTATFSDVQWIQHLDLAGAAFMMAPPMPAAFMGPPMLPPPSSRDAPSRSRCEEGSGSFLLVRTGPGYTYRPIQLAGSGVLSDDASVLRARTLAQIGTSLATRSPGHVPVALTGQWADIADGVLPGGSAFVSATRSTSPPVVEMSWSCPEEFETTRSRTQVAFRLAEIGCPVDWPQLLTLGIDAAPGRSSLWVGTYGSPGVRKSAQLTPGPTGADDTFRYVQGGLVVAGRLESRDESTATIALEEVSYYGLALCGPGVYALPLARPGGSSY